MTLLNMINFTEILSNTYIRNLGIPIFAVFMTTVVKIMSRKDHSLKITRTDIAIGINLIVTGMIMLINYSFKLAENAKRIIDPASQVTNTTKITNMMFLVLFYCIISFFLSLLLRLYGWKKDNEKEHSIVIGIIIPLIIGGFLLVVAANYSNQ